MKPESDPVSEDEWLIRRVWEDRVTKRVPIISPNAFEPNKNDTDGISFFRRDCLTDPTAALTGISEEKRARYALVQIPVTLLKSLNLTVRPAPTATVPGHVVIPEINITDYLHDKAHFTSTKLRLAEVASGNIIRWPEYQSGD